ncbi:MAG: ABC transporter substrate-binding protein [Acidobacteria bacterium]|nr:ABC transporter substrate-binding protein [Acidobacteriota bacterium]
MERREFLVKSATAAIGVVAATAVPAEAKKKRKAAKKKTTKKPTTTTTAKKTTATTVKPRKVTLGFIALTDCAPLVIAKELGFFEERGLDVTLQKQASWPATRDNLLSNQIDGGHVLFSMPMSVAARVGGNGQTSLKIAMVLNNNGQCITLKSDYAKAGYADLAAAKAILETKSPTLAMTFPGGTHDTWLRYWLKATKANLAKVDIVPFPPPTMVANMKVGNCDGFCVGEPWNAVAVAQDIGFTHLATQDLWTHHPEKALVVTEKFAKEQPDVLKELMGATLKACAWLDVDANRPKAAELIAPSGYVNAPAEDVKSRLTGHYFLGAGMPEKVFTDTNMKFHRGGLTNFPRRGHAKFFLAEFQRFGLIDSAPDYKLVDKLLLQDVYADVASKEGIAVPNDDLAPFTLKLDGATFDPANPLAEATRK